MTYVPDPIVTIDGVDYTGSTVNSISIDSGRSSVDEQPRAGHATINLVILDDSFPAIELGNRLAVSIVDSIGGRHSIFTGFITDVVRSIGAQGGVGYVTNISITVVGPLAQMARFATSPNYAKEYDGTRIANILASVFAESWNEVNPALTWSAVTAGIDWAHYDPSGYVGTVETPGDYQLVNWGGGEVAADSLAAQVANSALGVLYESGDGYINYYSATARADNVATNGFLTITADKIVGSGLSSSMSTANLINLLTVEYDNGSSVTGQNADSIDLYGTYSSSRSTLLEKAAEANQQLTLMLETRSYPRENLSTVTVPLDNPTLDAAILDALIGVYCGLPVAITGLPSTIRSYPFAGFVEGHQWQITRTLASLTLTLSDYGLTQIQQNWGQVNPAETWNTLSLTLDWENARSVA